MKVLVTGATGFLGQFLVDRLVKEGFDVTATGRNHQIANRWKETSVLFLPADLRDEETIVSLCQGKEIVFHCGALSSPWGDPNLFYQTNYLGTKHIIEGCKRHQVKRLIYVSSPSIYNQRMDQFHLTENSPLPRKPINDYAKTKWWAEQAIDQAFEEGLPVITIRPRAIFGPKDQAIFPRLLAIYERGAIPLFQRGSNLIDITYVENVVDALLLCIDASQRCLGKKYNITNDDPRPLIELLQILFQELEMPLKTKHLPFPIAYFLAGMLEFSYRWMRTSKEPPLTRYTISVIGTSQTFDISLAKEELGYQPKIDIEEGIHRFATWWRKQP